MEELTDKQDLVITAIRDYYLDNGFPPSLSELQGALGIGTKGGVVKHLKALEKKGYIFRTGKARGIQLVEDDFQYLLGIPVLGFANAGKPFALANQEDLGKISVSRKLVPANKELFALVIKGDSMNQKEINGIPMRNGNYAIVSKNDQVDNGDTVVAIIDGCATVKIFHKEHDMIVLYPKSDNPIHNPIYLDETSESMINGKVISVLNNPSSKY